MSTEVDSGRDTSAASGSSFRIQDFSRYVRSVKQRQKESRRRKLLRSVFGKTNKSPFTWGLVVATESDSPYKQIQNAHRQFWNTKQLTDSAAGNLARASGSLDSAQQMLAMIALCAYRNDFECAIPQELISQEPSLHQQLQVELKLWNQLNTQPDFNGIGVVDHFERMTDELLDGDGWPEAKVFHEFGLLAASWLRCAMLFEQLDIAIDATAESRLDWMCRQFLRSMRKDGSLFFNNQNSGINCRSFAKALADISLDSAIRKMLLQQSSDFKLRKKRIGDIPPSSSVSEWAQSGVLRSSWQPGAPAVGLLFGHSKIDMELAHKYSLIAGNCTPNIWINGQLLQPSSEICVTCDLSFDEVDLLELELDYEDWRLQRQILMLRDGLVMLADNVLGSESANIEYRCEYPLAADTEAIEESSTTEIYIRKGSNYNLVLPLALPEWQSERTEDRFLAQEGRLILTQSMAGQCMSAPLIFDMKPKRSVKPRTWRQLTVAENLEIVGKDVAVAYRVQIGREQWLFYRSLSRTGNRTFMGENVADEFFVGRIDLKGNISSLAEVE